MMLDEPQDMTAASRNGGLAAIQIDGAAEVEAKQLGARCQIVGVTGERRLERLDLSLGEAVALPCDARVGRRRTLLSSRPFDRLSRECNCRQNPSQRLHRSLAES